MLGATACGRPVVGPVPGASENQVTGPFFSPVPQEFSRQAVLEASQADVKCSGSSCHPAVGLLTAVDGTSAKGCTAFLVASDLVATSGACIPEAIQQASSCRGLVFMTFPAMSGLPTETRECLGLVDSSSADYALIRIAAPAVPRTPVSISRRGFQDAQNVTLIRANMTHAPSGRLSSTFSRQTCTVVQRSYYLPDFDQDQRAHVSLGGRDCSEGVSGAGGLLISPGSEPKALGILTGTLRLETGERASLQFQKLITGEPEKLISAASFSCIPLPADMTVDGRIVSPQTCVPAVARAPLDVPLKADDQAALVRKATTTLTDWRSSNQLSDRTFKWDLDLETSMDDFLRISVGSNLDAEMVGHAVPVCVKDPTALERRRTLQMPVWTYSVNLNTYLQKRLKLDSLGEPVTIALKASSSFVDGRYVIELSVPDPTNIAFKSYTKLSIPRCP